MTSGSKSQIKYNRSTLKKIEQIFGEIEFEILYEKGQFQSGYCLLEQKRMAVVNRFFDQEARIGCLLDILGQIEFDVEVLSSESQFFCSGVLVDHLASQISDD